MSELKELGVAIKAYRVALNETIEELAQATELQESVLLKIEAGEHKPDKSVIELLCRHFNLQVQEANRLLKLSGFSKNEFTLDLEPMDIPVDDVTKDFDVLVAPIFYTDMVNVTTNQYGVTVNFIQKAGSDGKPVVVSRVGMSHKHAQSVIDVLQESLRRTKLNNPQEPEAQKDQN